MNTPTPPPRPALKATGVRRRHARCLDTELATLTAERDQLRAEVKSCGELSCDECNARTAVLTAERDQLRLDCDNETKWAAHYLAQSIADKARAERAEDNLAALEQCHDDNCRGVAKIADDLTAERARLDWVFRNCKVFAADYTIHDREDLGAAMKEDAK